VLSGLRPDPILGASYADGLESHSDEFRIIHVLELLWRI